MLRARLELDSAEDALRAFVKANRSFDNDPELAVEHDRLEREVLRLQSVYLNISNSYEQARTEAAQAIPLITVVDHPDLPVVPDRRRTILKAAAAMLTTFVGFLISLLLVASWTVRRKADPEIAREVAALAQLTFGDGKAFVARVRGRA
jgi:uncharacterized protein involved in exopolysaccharide biosynthesis